MTKSTQILSPGQPNYIAKAPALPPHLVEYVRREEQTGKPSQDTAGTAGRIYLQERGGSEVDSSDDDDDPLPTHRQLFDRLLAAVNSGLFRFHCTIRTPTPSPAKGSPRYNPEEQEHLGNQIAKSLADLGIASIVIASFQSINTQRQNPHFHCLLSERPPYAWDKAMRERFGRRAVHVEEIGDQPQDAGKVAYYIAKQGVSVSVADPGGFTRSAIIEGKGVCVLSSFTLGEVGPIALAMNPPQTIPPDARMRLEALGLLRPRPPPRRSDNGTAAHRAIDNHTAHFLSNIGNKQDREETNKTTNATRYVAAHEPKTTEYGVFPLIMFLILSSLIGSSYI